MVKMVKNLVQVNTLAMVTMTTLTLAASTAFAQSGKEGPDMFENIMKMPENCVKAPPVSNDYLPTGSEILVTDPTIPDILVYETRDKTPTKIVIGAYDIYGFIYNNTKQVADILAAELNVRIVMPDYFRGSVFHANDKTKPTREEIAKFIAINGDWDDSVKADTLAVIEHYKKTANATSFGFFGWCWGGKITSLASIHIEDIDVAAVIHPGHMELDEAAQVKCPMYLMPGSDDADMIPFYEVLQENFGISNTGHRRFDLPHGFAGGNSNFSDPVVMAAVDEVITIITEFFGPRLQ